MNRKLPERIKHWYKTKTNETNLKPSLSKTKKNTKTSTGQSQIQLPNRKSIASSKHQKKKHSKVVRNPSSTAITERKYLNY